MKKQILSLASIVFVAGTLVLTSCKKEDTTAPVVTIEGSASATSILNATYTDPGAKAKDDKDGDLTPTSDFSTKFNKDLSGTYTITYTATDAAGNAGTATRTVEVYNEAKNTAGNYSVSDAVGGSTTTYSDAVTLSSTTNNKIQVSKFANYQSATVYMTVSGTTVTVPTQTVNSGSPLAAREFAGTGTIASNGTITINYTEKTNGTTVSGTGTYTKQ